MPAQNKPLRKASRSGTPTQEIHNSTAPYSPLVRREHDSMAPTDPWASFDPSAALRNLGNRASRRPHYARASLPLDGLKHKPDRQNNQQMLHLLPPKHHITNLAQHTLLPLPLRQDGLPILLPKQARMRIRSLEPRFPSPKEPSPRRRRRDGPERRPTPQHDGLADSTRRSPHRSRDFRLYGLLRPQTSAQAILVDDLDADHEDAPEEFSVATSGARGGPGLGVRDRDPVAARGGGGRFEDIAELGKVGEDEGEGGRGEAEEVESVACWTGSGVGDQRRGGGEGRDRGGWGGEVGERVGGGGFGEGRGWGRVLLHLGAVELCTGFARVARFGRAGRRSGGHRGQRGLRNRRKGEDVPVARAAEEALVPKARDGRTRDGGTPGGRVPGPRFVPSALRWRSFRLQAERSAPNSQLEARTANVPVPSRPPTRGTQGGSSSSPSPQSLQASLHSLRRFASLLQTAAVLLLLRRRILLHRTGRTRLRRLLESPKLHPSR